MKLFDEDCPPRDGRGRTLSNREVRQLGRQVRSARTEAEKARTILRFEHDQKGKEKREKNLDRTLKGSWFK